MGGLERYQLGRILNTGMIGVVYLVRDQFNTMKPLKCVKKMSASKMLEKNIFPSVRRELKIL